MLSVSFHIITLWDILASSSLTVQATEPFYFIFNARKTAGALRTLRHSTATREISFSIAGGAFLSLICPAMRPSLGCGVIP